MRLRSPVKKIRKGHRRPILEPLEARTMLSTTSVIHPSLMIHKPHGPETIVLASTTDHGARSHSVHSSVSLASDHRGERNSGSGVALAKRGRKHDSTLPQYLTIQLNNDTDGAFGGDSGKPIQVAIYAEDQYFASASNTAGWVYITPNSEGIGQVIALTPQATVPTFTLNPKSRTIKVPTTLDGNPLRLVSGQVYVGLGKPPVLNINSGASGAKGSNLVPLVSGGSGYLTAPNVSFMGGGDNGQNPSQPGKAVAAIANGAVNSLPINNGGSGYTSPPTVTLPASPSGGMQATAIAMLANGAVNSLPINNGGSGYTSTPTITLSAPPSGGTPATAIATLANGAVTGLLITNGGSGYTSAPTVTVAAPPPGGTQATATATIGNGVVSQLLITNGASGYTSAPTVTIAPPPTGTPATATTTIGNGVVTSLTIIDTGKFYISAPTVTITPQGSDPGSGASAVGLVNIAGVAAPAPSNSSDPNNMVNWNFAEFTYNDPQNDDQQTHEPLGVMFADVSQVDQTSFPLTIQINPKDQSDKKNAGSGYYLGRDATFKAFTEFVTRAGDSAKEKLSPFKPLLDDSPKEDNGTHYRILAPSNYALLNPNSPLNTYFNTELTALFAAGHTVTALNGIPAAPNPSTNPGWAPAAGTASVDSAGTVTTVTITNQGSQYTYAPTVTFSAPSSGTTATGVAIMNFQTGTVTGVKITNGGSGYTSPPSVTLTLRLGPYTYDGAVTTVGGSPAYQFTTTSLPDVAGVPQQPAFTVYSPLNPPTWEPDTHSPGWQVFACAGVFADNVNGNQFGNNPLGAAVVLGAIENQMVSAINRGVALQPYSSWLDDKEWYHITKDPSDLQKDTYATANWYSYFLHTYATIDGRCYGFAYDDQQGTDSTLSSHPADQLTINLGWNKSLPNTDPTAALKKGVR